MTRLRANALLLLAALIWGSAFVGQSLGMDSVGPLGFTALPHGYWLALAPLLLAYLTVTQIMKVWLIRRFGLN